MTAQKSLAISPYNKLIFLWYKVENKSILFNGKNQ